MKNFLALILVAFIVIGSLYLDKNTTRENDAPQISQRERAHIDHESTNTLKKNDISTAQEDHTNKNSVDLKNEHDNHQLASNIAELEERYLNASNNENYPTLASRVSEINERRPNANISPEDVVSAVEKSEAWQTREDPGLVEQKLSEKELNDGRAFVEFDPVKVETLMPEDHMDIDIDAIGRTLEMKVENVEVFSDGNIVWQGKIINQSGTDAENGTVTITQSPNITIASIILSDKDYTLESYGSDGWVSNSGALFRVDPNDDH